jgi:hypothetical protein
VTVQYFKLAFNVARLRRPCSNAETSMLKTWRPATSPRVSKMAARCQAEIETPHELRTWFEARIPGDGSKDLVAQFGGIRLQRNRAGFITDPSRFWCSSRARS